MKWGLLQTVAATAAHFRPARIFTDILDRICLFHDRRSFVPLAHKYCRGEVEELKVSVNRTPTIADKTVASIEQGNRQTAGEGRRSNSVGVVCRFWTGQRGAVIPFPPEPITFVFSKSL
jgi:hypothetical protein